MNGKWRKQKNEKKMKWEIYTYIEKSRGGDERKRERFSN